MKEIFILFVFVFVISGFIYEVLFKRMINYIYYIIAFISCNGQNLSNPTL